MTTPPEKPAGSVIVKLVDAEGIVLSWPISTPFQSRFIRYGVSPFVLFWLCGWIYGNVKAFDQNLRIGKIEDIVIAIVWLIFGGAIALGMLWALLRSTCPEVIRLGHDLLRYDPGRTFYYPSLPNGRGRWGVQLYLAPTPAFEIARSAIPEFKLERIGERQRLCFDRGADRVEIGATLREPEREWLFALLMNWKESNQLEVS